MKLDEFKNTISELFRLTLISEDDLKLQYKVSQKQQIKIAKTELAEVFTRLESYDTTGAETEIFNQNYYEVLVKFEFMSPVVSHMLQIFFKKDDINKIEYSLSKPSNEYLLFLVDKLQNSASDIARDSVLSLVEIGRTQIPQDNSLEFFDAIRALLPFVYTVQITCEDKKTIEDFDNLLYSYLFTVSYNLSLSLIPIKILEEFASSLGTVNRFSRLKFEEIEAPKRIYIKDLILYYQRGIFPHSIDGQYLAFYHIIEYFFEIVYNEDMIHTLRQEITVPSFSYKRDADIKKLIKVIEKKLKYKNDEFILDEKEALYLTLQKFIAGKLSLIKGELNSHDPNLVDYYKRNEVPFSQGNKVNFDGNDENELLKNLSQRIYKTRNAIVHSKETERVKYIPFQHDQSLRKEIYLMRLIAEQIIVESATII